MDQDTTRTRASFTGTLLRREHTLGQKFVRLVFRENDKDVLCVSTNPRTVMLPVGQTYRVVGEFKYSGERAYVFDPKIAALKKHWRPIRRVIFAGVLVACVAGLGGVAFMQQGGGAPAAPAVPAQQSVPKPEPIVVPTATAPVAASAATTPAPATTAVKPKTVVKTTVKASTAVTPTTTAPIVQASTDTTTPPPASNSTPTPSDASGTDSTGTPPADLQVTDSGTTSS